VKFPCQVLLASGFNTSPFRAGLLIRNNKALEEELVRDGYWNRAVRIPARQNTAENPLYFLAASGV